MLTDWFLSVEGVVQALLFSVGALMVFNVLAGRIRGLKQPAATDLFLEANWSGAPGCQRIVLPLTRTKGTLGRGHGQYALDPTDPFLARVSREHAILEVRAEGLYIAPCRSPRRASCVVDVEEPFGRTHRLSPGRPALVLPGSRVMLGSSPAPGFAERPTLVLQDLTSTLGDEPVSAGQLDEDQGADATSGLFDYDRTTGVDSAMPD